MDSSELIQRMSFSSEHHEVYPFLADYTRRVEASLHRLLESAAGRDRYCIVGLFPLYRAMHHWGLPFDTSNMPRGLSAEESRRVEAFRSSTGRDIDGARTYARLLGIDRRRWLGPLGTLGLGRSLSRFVHTSSSPWAS